MKKHNFGFTLVEMMVALLVLSIGLIGIAALHGRALAASGIAIHNTNAVNLAGNMADRIRANRLGRAAYEGPAADNGCDTATGGAASCTPAQLAANDLLIWQNEVARALPGGTGAIEVNVGTNPATYTVTVGWDEQTEVDPVTFVLEFQQQTF